MLLVCVVSCTQNPALVENKGLSHNSISNIDTISKSPFKVRVENGDNLYKISKRYGVGIRDLIEENNLIAPYILSPSQFLELPKARFHAVTKGDTLYAISRSYGVDLSRLIQVNKLKEPYVISQGEKLRIPSSTEESDSVLNVASKGEEYQSEGRTLATVVEKDIGNIESPEIVLPKQVKPSEFESALFNEESDLGSVDSDVPTPALRASSYPTPSLKPGSELAQETRSDSIKAEFQPTTYSSDDFITSEYKSTGFQWPTNGTVISRFGPKSGGLYNDGINIRAASGTPIVAADNGVVVYSGNELRGYGNLILIKHSNGYVTAYAHADSVFVKKGQLVKKGQKIANVGKTGHVSVPQLHFSVRKGRKALDPQIYLPVG